MKVDAVHTEHQYTHARTCTLSPFKLFNSPSRETMTPLHTPSHTFTATVTVTAPSGSFRRYLTPPRSKRSLGYAYSHPLRHETYLPRATQVRPASQPVRVSMTSRLN